MFRKGITINIFLAITTMLLSFFIVFITVLRSYAEPTNEEQYMLELINRARSNPSAEGERLAQEYNRPELKDAFATYLPSPPLAFNEALIQAARNHSQYCKLNNLTGHVEHPGDPGYTGSSPSERVIAVGFQGKYAGENCAFGYNSVLKCHDGLLIDDDVPSLGHRYNILDHGRNRNCQEIGIGIIEGGPCEGLTVTQDFGIYYSYIPKILGVVYIDYNKSHFYDPGEGLEGISITVNPGNYTTHTTFSGGYSLPISRTGSYTVTATGGQINTMETSQVTINNVNVKVDFVLSSDKPLIIKIPEDFDTIQEGLQAAVCGNSIVYISPGLYLENLVLNKGIILEGEGPELTIIDGQGKKPVIQVKDTQHPCEIRNLTLRNGKTTSSYGQGAGIDCDSSELKLVHMIITNNEGAGSYGVGAIYARDSMLSLENVTITRNTSIKNVEGIGYSNSTVIILNSIIWGNAGWGDYDLYGYDSNGGKPDIRYSNLGKSMAGIGNISKNPQFINPDGGDYHLRTTSPCKNAGHPGAYYYDEDSTRNDMGAFGGVMTIMGIEQCVPDHKPVIVCPGDIEVETENDQGISVKNATIIEFLEEAIANDDCRYVFVINTDFHGN